jgi:dTMP kinase
VDVKNVTKIWELSGGIWPDLTLILTVSPEIALERARKQTGQGGDRMEQRSDDYHTKVDQGFAQLAKTYPAPVAMIPADGSIADVTNGIEQALIEVFG